MSDFIKGVQVGSEVKQYDYDALGNKPNLVEVDTTLSASGKAADAKVVGTKFTTVEQSITNTNTAVQNTNVKVTKMDEQISGLSDLVGKSFGVAICQTASGESIAVNDSANAPLQGLTLYGKSTQDGTPTTYAPIDIISSGDNGSITTYLYSKCLVDFSSLSYVGNCVFSHKGNHIHFENNSGETCYVKTKKITLPAGTYTAYIKNVVSKNNNYTLGIQSDSSSHYLHATHNIFTFTLEKSENFSLQITTDNTTDLDVWDAYVGIVCGEASIEECPTIDTDIPIPRSMVFQTPDGLRGLKVTSGGNYTDADGQQWICDEVDLARGVYVQNCFETTLTDFSSATVREPMEGFTEGQISCGKTTKANALALCDAFPFKSIGNEFRFAMASKTIFFTLEGELTTSEWIARMNEISPTILIPLATPIETPLSETEIAAYRALHSNYPNTTVLNTDGAYMTIKYVADTKTYIDNKLAELVSK